MLSTRTQLEHLRHAFWDKALSPSGRLSEAEIRERVRSLLMLRLINERFSAARLALSNATRNVGSVYYRDEEDERESIVEDARLYRVAGVPWVPAASRWGRVYTRAQKRSPGGVLVEALEALEQPGVSELAELWQLKLVPSRRIRGWLQLVDQLGLREPLPTLSVLEHLLELPMPTALQGAATAPPVEVMLTTISEEKNPGGRAARLISGLETQVREFEELVRRLGGQVKS